MRHHYIPEFYLKPWVSAEDHKLQEFGRAFENEIRTRRRGTASTGWAEDLYTVPGVTEETKQNVESSFMGMVDTSAVKARNMMLEGKVPADPPVRHAWARFLLSLLMRNPEAVRDFKASFELQYLTSDAEIEEKYAKLRRPWYPETAVEFLLLDPTRSERQAVLILTNLIQHENITRSFRQMAWAVIDTSLSSRRLMTSDRPLVMTNGIDRPEGHVGIPISPTKLFVGCMRPAYLSTFTKMPVAELTALVNQAVIGQARSLVYAVDAKYWDQVKREMATRDHPQLLPTRKQLLVGKV